MNESKNNHLITSFLSMIGFRWNQGRIWLIPIRKPLRTSLHVRRMKMFEDGDIETNNNEGLLVD